MISFLKKHRKLIIALLFVVGLIAFKFFSGPRYQAPEAPEKTTAEVEETQAPIEKTSETILFGGWTPTQAREVLAQVESDNEVAVTSEISGTISAINANIGDVVYEGQTLARFKLTNDPTQINYLNALSNLTAVEATTKSNIQSAEIAVRNAETELEQTISQQGQNQEQALTSLRTQAQSAQTTIESALNYLDRQLGASRAYDREVVFGRAFVGSKNFLLKNRTEYAVLDLVREFEALKKQPIGSLAPDIELYSQTRINFAKRVKTQLDNYDTLVRDTIISTSFSEVDQNTIQGQVDAQQSSVDGLIINLTNLIESTKGTGEGNKTAILSAENRVKSAREQLEIARAQADAQIIGAKAQVSSATAAQTDLVVTAPIRGKVVERQINRGQQVSFGSPLFTIVNEDASKKVVAFLSNEEWNQIQTQSEITVNIDGQMIQTNQSFLSARVDPTTQKIRTEFLLPANTDVLVGSFVEVLIPLESEGGKILPISAIAFEPDGAEVLILDRGRIAQRQKVVVGDIVADSVQILSGIPDGTEVVKYRNRVFAGEKVINPAP